MTKKSFVSLWSHIEFICKKKVNGECQISAVCEINSEPDSYRLVLRPNCILWSHEICGLVGLIGLKSLSVYFNFGAGTIEIF